MRLTFLRTNTKYFVSLLVLTVLLLKFVLPLQQLLNASVIDSYTVIDCNFVSGKGGSRRLLFIPRCMFASRES